MSRWLLPFLLLASCANARESAERPRKVALIVAIADYPSSSGWKDLSSDRDLVVMRAALERQGFDQILELTDRAATRSGLEKAFQRFREKTSPGDVAFFHYSGHGHRITDDDHDEEDGYDEVLVPYGALRKPPADYKGEKHVRDDELGSWLKQLRQRVGEDGEVVVSLDSCFSGTATRGESTARGDETPIGKPQTPRVGAVSRLGGGWLEDDSGARGAPEAGGRGLAPLVALSAARHDELAYQTKDDAGEAVGSLSLALGTALAAGGPALTYRGLFERVKILMAGYRVSNTPQAEGSGLDRALFAGRAVEQDPFFEVVKVNRDGTLLRLAGGSILGLFTDTRVEIYPAGTRAWKKRRAIASGIVVEAEPLTATVELETAADAGAATGAWAYVTHQSFGSLGVTVRLEGGDAAWASAVEARLKRADLIRLGDDSDVVIREADGAAGVIVETTEDGYPLLGPIPADAKLADRVAQHLADYSRNRYLRRLSLRSGDFSASFELLPCRLDCDAFRENCKCEAIPAEDVTVAGNLRLNEGMGFEVEVRNYGRKEAYVSILDLMPNGEWSVLWPPWNQDQVPLPAGKTYRLDDLWEVEPPYGTDVLKLFVSEDPIDFHWLLGPRRLSRGAPPNPLEKLFDEILTEYSRGGQSRKSIRRDAGVTTTSLILEIVP